MFGDITEMLYICSVLIILTVQIYKKNVAYNDDFKQKF